MLLDLPPELIEHILIELPLPDLLNLTTVNPELCEAIRHSHHLWYHHLRVRDLVIAADEGSPCSLDSFKLRYQWTKDLERYLDELSHHQIYNSIVEIDLEDAFVLECYTDPICRQITLRYLRNIVISPNQYTRLTTKLYARHFLVVLAQLEILSDLKKYTSSSNKSLLLASLLVSRWVGACLFEPAIIHNSVNSQCIPVEDTIEDIVGQCRAQLSPTSKIEEVLKVVSKVLYDDFGLKNNSENYYDYENSRTDKVLYNRKGIPITMAIIYHEIGTKLGLTLSLINFPRHFLLSFVNSEGVTMYLDCYNRGEILTRRQCLQLCPMSDIADNDAYFQSVSGDAVLARLLRNTITFSQMVPPPAYNNREFFILNLYKLMAYVFPSDFDSAIHAVSLSLDFGIKCNFLRRFKRILSEKWDDYQSMINNIEVSVKRKMSTKPIKPPHVTFSIGAVMLHKRYNYTCVLNGWDEVCSMGPQWELQNGVSNLQFQGGQPFYRVLAGDGSDRYVAQENLFETRSEFISHRDVGKYFIMYDGERFVPNSALKSIYSHLKNE